MPVQGMRATGSGQSEITSKDRSGIVGPIRTVQLMQMPRQAHHERQLDLFLEEPALHHGSSELSISSEG